MDWPQTFIGLEKLRVALGANPLLFYGATLKDCGMEPSHSCETLWTPDTLYAALCAIKEAEDVVERVLGMSIGPRWETALDVTYPRTKCNNMLTSDGASQQSVTITGNRFAMPGQRGVRPVALAQPITFVDDDGDGWPELGVVEIAIGAGDPDPDCCALQAFQAGTLGAAAAQIRDIAHCAFDTATRVLKVIIPTVNLIKPELMTTSSYGPTAPRISLCCTKAELANGCTNPKNVVTTLDLYQLFNDTTAAPVELIYTKTPKKCGGCGSCAVCLREVLPACLVPLYKTTCKLRKKTKLGLQRIFRTYLQPVAANWVDPVLDPNTGAELEAGYWCASKQDCCKYGDPAAVNVHYLAGCVGDLTPEQAATAVCVRPCKDLERAVLCLAMARMPAAVCQCVCAKNNPFEQKQAVMPEDFRHVADKLDVFFGWRAGEIEAARILSGMLGC